MLIFFDKKSFKFCPFSATKKFYQSKVGSKEVKEERKLQKLTHTHRAREEGKEKQRKSRRCRGTGRHTQKQ